MSCNSFNLVERQMRKKGRNYYTLAATVSDSTNLVIYCIAYTAKKILGYPYYSNQKLLKAFDTATTPITSTKVRTNLYASWALFK